MADWTAGAHDAYGQVFAVMSGTADETQVKKITSGRTVF